MKTIRVFIAHSKSDDDNMLSYVMERISKILHAAANGRANVETVLGRDDFASHFKSMGSWDSWAQSIIDRIDHATREPVYNAIVVTSRFVGAATARIVEAAFRAGRPLMLLGDDGTLRPIREIRHVENNYKTGWEVVAS